MGFEFRASQLLPLRLFCSVAVEHLQAGNKQHIHDLIITVGLINDQFAARGGEGDKIFVLYRDASAVGAWMRNARNGCA